MPEKMFFKNPKQRPQIISANILFDSSSRNIENSIKNNELPPDFHKQKIRGLLLKAMVIKKTQKSWTWSALHMLKWIEPVNDE